jgi:hypothetical protein
MFKINYLWYNKNTTRMNPINGTILIMFLRGSIEGIWGQGIWGQPPYYIEI